MNIKKVFILCCVITGVLFSSHVKAQNINQQNFSNVKVDELSDEQIRSFIRQVEASGLSEGQLEQVAASKGMSQIEIQKLKERVNKIKSNTVSQTTEKKTDIRKSERSFEGEGDSIVTSSKKTITSEAELALSILKSKIFGKDLFANSSSTFEPNLRLATPLNYVIGTGDELLIDIYGYSEVSYQLTVSPEGTINIPYAGITPVSGLTIEAATARIRSKLAPIYSGLNSGNTKMSINIGNIRSIKVILTGEITKPGTYTLPSLATVFNALYSSGGPTENGSFRNIEIIRGGKLLTILDVYDFLLMGDLKNNIRLQDQDIIRVPTYKNRVEIVGEVKRPAIFEIKDDEGFEDLLQFAGGFTEKAYTARVKVLKNTATERKIADIIADQFSTYKPQSGDKFFVDEILDRFENRVTIEGAVFRPGQYELLPGLSLKKLIEKAEGLKEDAFKNRAYITRLTPDNQTELISFDLEKVLNGQAEDISIKREDIITISSIFDLKEEYTIEINGEVRKPGTFKFSENTSLEELIIQAGGFKESASAKRIEISRRVVNNDDIASTSKARTAEVFQVEIDKDLSLISGKFILKPFDIVTIRSAAGYQVQKQVKIEGEVMFPGTYSITRKDERISDLIRRAGGLTDLAYSMGASLNRKEIVKTQSEKEQEEIKLQQFQKLQKGVKDTLSLDMSDKSLRNDFVGINLPKILDNPGNREDLLLEEGDVLNVPRELQTVKVSGEVLSPVTIVYKPSKGFKRYVSNAGGFTSNAIKSRSYIIYANGSVEGTSKVLFFNNFPSVKPGAEIFVPKREERKKLTTGEIVGLTSGIASLGAIILGVLNIMK